MFNFKSHSRQKGQAILFVLVFTPILLLSVLMLYNSGKLSSEKMKLQNAADAAAYSISILEARDLNFTAYTNRAMIGNEIAIAQLVGLYSWLDMWGSTLQFFDLYIITPLEALAAGTLGILSAIPGMVKALKEVMVKGVEAVKKGIKTVGKLATKGVAALNLAYSYAQLGMHYVTVFLTLSVIDRVIGDNAPGAKLSDFGFFALAAHMGTYYANPGFEKTLVHHNASTEKEEMGLLMRKQYAATVNGSRDSFSKDRGGGWNQIIIDIDKQPMNLSFDDMFGGSVKLGFSVDLGIGSGGVSFEAGAYFAAGAEIKRRGGTDLRLTETAGKQYYSWTGVDIIGLNMWVKFEMFMKGCADLELLGFTVFDECLDILDVGINKDKNPLVWLELFGSELISLNAAEAANMADFEPGQHDPNDFGSTQQYDIKIDSSGDIVKKEDFQEAVDGDVVVNGKVIKKSDVSTNSDGDHVINGSVVDENDYKKNANGDWIEGGTVVAQGDFSVVPTTGASAKDNSKPLVAKISWMGIEIVEFEFPLKPEIDVPFGVGTGQIASAQGIMTTPKMYGVDNDEYGKAPGDLPITYNFPGACAPPAPKGDCGVPLNMGMPDSMVFNGHKGLPPFNSVVPNEIMADLAKKYPKLQFIESIDFFAPNLVIGLVKERSDITTSSEIVNETGLLKLDNKLQDDEIGAIAKSEVYFSRPTDSLATHFNRLDGKTEFGSAYNPFWQARLIETKIPERVIALLFQQKQIWALSGVSLTLPLGLGTFDLNVMLSDLGLI